MKDTTFMGYRVTESGLVFNCKGKLVKPKFYMRGKKIDYVYIDVTCNKKKQRISYHRFIYMAWNPEFAEVNDPNLVVTTIGRRFDYSIKNLKVVTRQEHIEELAKLNSTFTDDEAHEVASTYEEIKDMMTKSEYAKRLQISLTTLNKYLKGDSNGT